MVILFGFLDPPLLNVVRHIAPPERFVMRVTRRLQRRGRWRSWIAACALVALAWPSLGLLPWVASDAGAFDQAATHEHSAASAHDHDHDGDASAIPGSPTHPADHDCFQCQVLKHLSRCVLPLLESPAIPVQPGCAVQPSFHDESQFAARVVSLPPARGPPLPSA